jgi:hypothetical protein
MGEGKGKGEGEKKSTTTRNQGASSVAPYHGGALSAHKGSVAASIFNPLGSAKTRALGDVGEAGRPVRTPRVAEHSRPCRTWTTV